MSTIFLITHFHGFKIGPGYHEELVRRAAAMPAELDGHLEKLQNDQFQRRDLEKLAHELRTMAFKSLVPQYPQFTAGLKEISLDLRRHVLRWAKNAPRKDEAIGAVQDIRERLAQLIDKYGSSQDLKR
jgi:chromosome segregation ATPase